VHSGAVEVRLVTADDAGEGEKGARGAGTAGVLTGDELSLVSAFSGRVNGEGGRREGLTTGSPLSAPVRESSLRALVG
jgi:hypothetical protein